MPASEPPRNDASIYEFSPEARRPMPPARRAEALQEFQEMVRRHEQAEVLVPFGRFVSDFEHLMFVVRVVIAMLPPLFDGIDPNAGLELVEILLYRSPAGDQANKLRWIVSHFARPNQTDAKALGKVFNRLDNLVTERNNIVHSHSFVSGIHEHEGERSLPTRHFSVSKSGSGFQSSSLPSSKLESLSAEATSLQRELMQLPSWAGHTVENRPVLGIDENGCLYTTSRFAE